jgi:HK97 family phage major capsid protein
VGKVPDCINSGKYLSKVTGEAAAANINATPTIKINGDNYDPSTPDALVAKIKGIVGDVPGIGTAATPATYQTVDVGGVFTSFDPFADAISLVESVGSVVTSFAASFETVNFLSKLKRFQPTADVVSNEPLFSQTPGDVANPVRRSIFGVPLYSAPEGTIPDGVVWAIAADKVFTVMRQDITVTANPSFYFGSDSTAVRGTMRLGYGFPHAAAVVQINGALPGS